MIKVADYIASRAADAGITQVFMITGGGAMHLNDAFGKEPRLQYVCNHHEQACAMAAEGYARVTGRPALVNVTTGPGGINALNGVFGAFTDSIPMLVVSGQVKRETCMAFRDVPALRQLGDQEVDIIRMVGGITKYAVELRDPADVRYELEKALHIMLDGRPGPVWIDVPIDVQAAMVDEATLRGFEKPAAAPADLSNAVAGVIDRIRSAKRPALLVGTGIRVAGAVDVFERVIRKLGIPVTTAWTAHDLIATDDPLFAGRPSTVGDRAGNFVVQSSDVLLVIGCRLHIRQISYNWEWFARGAYKIQVDVDLAELDKPTVKPDLAILADARAFLEELERQLGDGDSRRHDEWRAWATERPRLHPVVQAGQRTSFPINPYHFVDVLVRKLDDDDVIVCGDGAACVVTFQVAHLRRGQRLWTNAGSASMGYDLPAAIGAAVARGGKRVICLAGDGSVQMNIQELQTVVHYKLPIKMFVLNNGGYQSIRQTQLAYFGRLVGESPVSGVSFPDMVKIGAAYGLPSMRIEALDFEKQVDAVLASEGAIVTEVMLDPKQQFEPKLSSRQLPDGKMVSSPLEDMYPFLSREELRANLLIPPLEE
jgi:acetolactate synthase I/II/III large subunit